MAPSATAVASAPREEHSPLRTCKAGGLFKLRGSPTSSPPAAPGRQSPTSKSSLLQRMMMGSSQRPCSPQRRANSLTMVPTAHGVAVSSAGSLASASHSFEHGHSAAHPRATCTSSVDSPAASSSLDPIMEARLNMASSVLSFHSSKRYSQTSTRTSEHVPLAHSPIADAHNASNAPPAAVGPTREHIQPRDATPPPPSATQQQLWFHAAHRLAAKHVNYNNSGPQLFPNLDLEITPPPSNITRDWGPSFSSSKSARSDTSNSSSITPLDDPPAETTLPPFYPRQRYPHHHQTPTTPTGWGYSQGTTTTTANEVDSMFMFTCGALDHVRLPPSPFSGASGRAIKDGFDKFTADLGACVSPRTPTKRRSKNSHRNKDHGGTKTHLEERPSITTTPHHPSEEQQLRDGRTNMHVLARQCSTTTLDTYAREDLEDEIIKMKRMGSWDTIGTNGTMGTAGTLNTHLSTSTAGTGVGSFASAIVPRDDTQRLSTCASGLLLSDGDSLGGSSYILPVDDDGHVIPVDVFKRLQARAMAQQESAVAAAALMKQNARSQIKKRHKKYRRRRLVQFDYPPISSVKECPRVDPDDIDKLFFSPQELDQLEDDRDSSAVADDVEMVAVRSQDSTDLSENNEDDGDSCGGKYGSDVDDGRRHSCSTAITTQRRREEDGIPSALRSGKTTFLPKGVFGANDASQQQQHVWNKHRPRAGSPPPSPVHTASTEQEEENEDNDTIDSEDATKDQTLLIEKRVGEDVVARITSPDASLDETWQKSHGRPHDCAFDCKSNVRANGSSIYNDDTPHAVVVKKHKNKQPSSSHYEFKGVQIYLRQRSKG